MHLAWGLMTESIKDCISQSYFIVIMIKLKAYSDCYLNCRTCSWDGWRFGNLRSWGRVGFRSCIHRFLPRYLLKPVQTSFNPIKLVQTYLKLFKPVQTSLSQSKLVKLDQTGSNPFKHVHTCSNVFVYEAGIWVYCEYHTVHCSRGGVWVRSLWINGRTEPKT